MVASARMKWFALALLSVTQFIVVLDIAVVNVALPSIQTDLGFSQENLQWVISAYALVFGGFLLLGGRLADISGVESSSWPVWSSSRSARFCAAWPGAMSRLSSPVRSRVSAPRR